MKSKLPLTQRWHENLCAKKSTNPQKRNNAPHRSWGSICKKADECGSDNAGAVLDRTDQRRHRPGTCRKKTQCTGNRVGDDEARRGDEQKQRDDQPEQTAPICSRIHRQQHTGKRGA